MPISYRVGNVDNTVQATAWVRDEVGVNANLLGHLTPQMVRQMSLDAKAMSKQLQMAKVFCKEAKAIMNGKVEIERLRKELLEHGLASKEEVDEVVKQMILLTEKHKGHIAKMLQDMTQGKQLIQAKSASDLSLGRSAFQNKLRELRSRHQAKQADQDEALRETLQGIQSDRRQSKLDRANGHRFNNYITAADRRGDRYAIGNGPGMPSLMSKAPVKQRGGAFGGGLLSRLFS